MRHGQAESNVGNVFHLDSQYNSQLTELGKEQVLESSKNFKEKIDIIISSPLERAKQTTKIISEKLNLSAEKINYDERIREWEVGNDCEGKSKDEVFQYFHHDYINMPTKEIKDGENFSQVIKRVGEFIYDIESKYKDKNVLISCHGGAIRALQFVVNGFSFSNLEKFSSIKDFENAEIKELDFIPLPHNENYELDLHKPYIDEVELVCTCGGNFKREKEVMDVWLDSGAMPFAQDHYPFEGKEQQILYPADFICEAIDQTRGWFYTLHAVGILMGRGKAYKNVICLGHLLDAKGKKMSKSLGNIVDPWIMMDKYGVDTLRLWMYSVNQPGESKNFDEKTVMELHRQVFGLLYNVLAFYELYRDKSLEQNFSSPTTKIEGANVLDQWIIARLGELVENSTKQLDDYKLLEPVRAIREFIDDLSTWYLRRSRERIKNGDKEAKMTLYYVLKNLVKLMAPFTPFASEDIWQKLKTDKDEESIHLTSWFEVKETDKHSKNIIKEMKEVREVVTLGLQARQKAGIPVRQPLKELRITNLSDDKVGYELKKEYFEIIKDELNVKEIKIIKGEEKKVEIDTNLTEELKQEGNYRELVRAIQDIRKKNGLNPNDVVSLEISTSSLGQELINKFKNELLKAVGAKDIQIKDISGEKIKISDLEFVINVVK